MATKEELFAALRLIKEHCEGHDVQYCGHECPFADDCCDYFVGAPCNWPDPEKMDEENGELKACPFCGNNETHLIEVGAIDHGEEKRPHGYRFTGYVVCLNCFAKATGVSFYADVESAKQEAIKSWNRRASND